MAYLAGLFDNALAGYSERGLEETGRLEMWPLAFDRFLHSPLVGVGVSHVGTWTPKQGLVVTPHNTLLFLALSAGIVPLGFFIIYAVRAARLTMSSRLNAEWHPDQPFRLPLLVYLFVIAQSGENTFMQPWGIVALSLAMAAEIVRGPLRVRQGRMSNTVTPTARPERRTFAYQRR
jgi:O-antigen ligase